MDRRLSTWLPNLHRSVRCVWKWRWLAVSVAWGTALLSGLLIALLAQGGGTTPGPRLQDAHTSSQAVSTTADTVEEQVRRHESQLAQAEARLKQFNQRHLGGPERSPQDLIDQATAWSEDVSRLQTELAAALRTRDLQRTQLAHMGDPAAGEGGQQGGPTSPPGPDELRLQAMRGQLQDLLRRFTEAHPDVIHLRQAIARLEAHDMKEPASLPPAAVDLRATQRLRVMLSEAEAEVGLLRSELESRRKDLEELRSRVNGLPGAEPELARLNRERDQAREQLDQWLARRGETGGGAGAEAGAEAGVAQTMSTSAPWPGQLAWAAGAALLSVVAAGLAVLVAETMRPTVDDSATLARISGRPLLGSIPASPTGPAQRAARQDATRLAWAAASLCALQLAWLGWLAWESFRKAGA